MATVRKIYRSGNSLVVSLPREVLESLHLGEGASLVIDVDQEAQRIVLAPAETVHVEIDEEFARQVAEFIDAYRPALEALAR